MDYEQNLVVRIAWLYYKEGLTQQDIGDKLGISRQRVIKYLDTARLANVVQFQIDLAAQNYLDVQNALMERYHLDDVYVAPPPVPGVSSSHTVSVAAAQYVGHKLDNTNQYSINVGAGKTVTNILSHLTVPANKTLTMISLTGGVHYYLHPQGPFNIIHSPQERIRSYIIPAPLCASTAEAARCFMNEPSVKSIMNMTKLADMTLLGIGVATQNATMVEEGIMSSNDIAILQMQNAVGDMLSQYYDINGHRVEFEMHDRFVTSHLDILKELKNVVGVAGGKEKVQPLLGALNGGYLNVLITDLETAQAVLKEGDKA